MAKGLPDDTRPYWGAVIRNVLRVLFWPENRFARAWHIILVLGTALGGTEFRTWLETALSGYGIQIEGWHYFAVAAVLAILTLAIELARRLTPRIVPTIIRYVNDDDWYYVKLQIHNRSSVHCHVWVQIGWLHNGEPFAKNGRDSFVLLTQTRVAERKLLDSYQPSLRERLTWPLRKEGPRGYVGFHAARCGVLL